MKIYVMHATAFDFINELYKPLQTSELSRIHSLIFPHIASSPIDSKSIIKESDLVLAEVSYPSTGMGIELGWADIFSKPILCVHRSNVRPSSALNFVTTNFLAYDSPAALAEKVGAWLEGHVAELAATAYKP